MLEMPSDLDRPWEPWTFKVGDRVRVRLSGECRWARFSKALGDGHLPVEDGLEGEIVDWPEGWPRGGGHDLAVWFDSPPLLVDPDTGVPGYLTRASYAAIELELLEDNRA